MKNREEKVLLGVVEEVKIFGRDRDETVSAKVDTGATRSSIDIELASQLNLGPITDSKTVRSANGVKVRPVIEAEIEIHGRKVTKTFTLADRSHMSYKVLIGRNILSDGFLIDPSLKEGGSDEDESDRD